MTFNQYKEYSFDRIGKAQLSDENKLFIDKSMLERYRKYKCCVFIDFEYSNDVLIYFSMNIFTLFLQDGPNFPPGFKRKRKKSESDAFQSCH